MVNLLALVAAAGLAAGAPEPSPAAAPEPPAPAAPADAQARYDAAFRLLLDGRLAEAALGFEALARDPAAAALSNRARALAEASRALDARGVFVPREPRNPAPERALEATPAPGTLPPPRTVPLPRRRLDQRGVGELTLYSAAYGLWAGPGLAFVLGADDPRVFAAAAIAGGGAGILAGTVGTRGHPVPVGRAQVVEAAGVWGGLNGGLVAGLADANARATVGTTLGLGLGGIAGAVALTRERSPSSGDVALVNSGGFWGLAAGALTLTFISDPSEEQALTALLVGADAGLLAMSLATRRVEISRGRSLLIDTGGLVGALVGLSVPLFARSESAPAYGAGGLGGMAVGLALGAHLTSGWDDDPESERRGDAARVMPFVARAPGGTVAAGFAGAF